MKLVTFLHCNPRLIRPKSAPLTLTSVWRVVASKGGGQTAGKTSRDCQGERKRERERERERPLSPTLMKPLSAVQPCKENEEQVFMLPSNATQ